MGVDTWDDAPAVAEGAGWKADTAGAGAGGFEPDTAGGADGAFTGDFAEENISKHANGDLGAPHDGGCRVCGDESHFARDCPSKPGNSGVCFNCGEEGHNKVDCVNERVEREFTGNCKMCGKPGHRQSQCSENRFLANFASVEIDELAAGDAWKALEVADTAKDVDDIKTAILAYAKAYPEITLEELESVFRETGMKTFLIAKQQEVSDTHTIVNLQGKIDQKYVVSFQFSAKPRRAKFAEGWPATPEENMTRLAEAGLPLDRMVPKCSNCNEMGHISKNCEQEKVEPERLVISCANCNEEGHRARDCTAPRKSNKKECKNCGEEGHFAKDCEKERVMVCRNCDGAGHTSKECPEPKNMAKVQCRNCDEFGHTGRDCPKPTDWSRVECSNCHEKGHSYKRCPQPAAYDNDDENGGGGGGFADGGAAGGGGNWGGDEAPAAAANGGW